MEKEEELGRRIPTEQMPFAVGQVAGQVGTVGRVAGQVGTVGHIAGQVETVGRVAGQVRTVAVELQVDTGAVVRPRAELHVASLLVERKPGDVDLARAHEDARRHPQTGLRGHRSKVTI